MTRHASYSVIIAFIAGGSVVGAYVQETPVEAPTRGATDQPNEASPPTPTDPNGKTQPASDAPAEIAGVDTPKIYPLETAKAAALAETVKRVFGTAVIVVDDRTNSLLVNCDRCDPARATEIDAVVRTLDELSARDATRKAIAVGTVQISPLKCATASTLATILTSLFPIRPTFDPQPVFVADEATNSLFIRCDDERLQAIKDVVAKLDQPTATPSDDASGARITTIDAILTQMELNLASLLRTVGPKHPQVVELEARIRELKGLIGEDHETGDPALRIRPDHLESDLVGQAMKDAERRAEQHRELENGDANAKQIAQSKNMLRDAVDKAFEARQQHQRAELANLQQRHRRIEELIEARERIKDQIIDHRVEELLNPALRWDESSPRNADQPSPNTTAARAIRDKRRERLELIEEAYRAGEAALTEVLTAAKELAEAEADTAESAAERRLARQKQVDVLRQLNVAVEAKRKAGVAAESDVLAIETELLKADAQLNHDANQLGDGDEPRLEGVVLSRSDGALVEISVGHDDGVQEGVAFHVFDGQTILGQIEITRIEADKSVARIVKEDAQAPIRRGDRVSNRLDARGAAKATSPRAWKAATVLVGCTGIHADGPIGIFGGSDGFHVGPSTSVRYTTGFFAALDGRLIMKADILPKDGEYELFFRTYDGVAHDAELAYLDHETGLCVLRPKKPMVAPAVFSLDSGLPQVGQNVDMAYTFPKGDYRGPRESQFSHFAYDATVVATGRLVGELAHQLIQLEGDDWGGDAHPVFDSESRLVGVIFPKVSQAAAEDVLFALPASYVESILQRTDSE